MWPNTGCLEFTVTRWYSTVICLSGSKLQVAVADEVVPWAHSVIAVSRATGKISREIRRCIKHPRTWALHPVCDLQNNPAKPAGAPVGDTPAGAGPWATQRAESGPT